MLKHAKYDKIKLLHELSCLLWFIEQHAKSDAQNDNDKEFHAYLEKLSKDLNSYIEELNALCCK